MAIFYSVDRRGRLVAGQQATLAKYSDVTPKELSDHVNELFPDGVSPHGSQYLLSPPGPGERNALTSRIEGYTEAVRRAHYPDRPSRFVSMFGSKTLEEALVFRQGFGAPTHPIYEVECERWFEADMHLLESGESILMQSHYAHCYWAQRPGAPLPCRPPLWEVLLPLPLTVLRRVA